MSIHETDGDPGDISTWLTINQVVDLIGCAHITVKTWVSKGTLHPRKARRQVGNGSLREVWVFDPREIARVPRRRTSSVPSSPGEIAARAFELFDEGRPDREVVTDLRETPQRVAELREQWMLGGGSEIVIGRVAAQEIARFIGPFDGVAGLVQRLRALHGATILASVPETIPDAQVERAINAFLDQEAGPTERPAGTAG